jgi:hypothetical protein
MKNASSAGSVHSIGKYTILSKKNSKPLEVIVEHKNVSPKFPLIPLQKVVPKKFLLVENNPNILL